ncbi:HPP family protein [Pandoraea fibrosis]|uniref:CBS domain-containing protein n=2 Tax=Pandoraea fibrosis TaxID=1891094 RepID=A0A5E4RLR6_9BURK|nr:CBS domain-containing protein [Pandoraea fibrosis]QHF13637.1 CBS domain-containing protein [Pandoraea fibrosis]VVD64247.1 Inosine-5'-monophosphate dehydrogenase [Pandoraea fibrosis]
MAMTQRDVRDWLAGFLPAVVAVHWKERLRAGIGALCGIALTGGLMLWMFGPATYIPWLVAPMGASAVLLFGVPASPLAQPWSILGGNLVSAFVGVTCATFIPSPVVAAATAVGVSIALMFTFRCVHPPSGAVALTAVLGGPAVHSLGYGFVLEPIALQSVLLLGAAIGYHALTGHRYPHAVRAQAPARPVNAAAIPVTTADAEKALERRGELFDISAEDLASLLRDTQREAYARRARELTCADVMSAPLAKVQANDDVPAAWRLLQRHGLDALPVVDDDARVIGLLTRHDLHARRARRQRWPGFGAALGTAQRPSVRDLMQGNPKAATTSMPLSELVPLLMAQRHGTLPVLDDAARLVGVVTHAEVLRKVMAA